MNIYPSVLETDIDTFVTRIQNYAPIFAHMQIDIADGVLVDNKTIQIEDITHRIEKGDVRMENNTFEFHLMVKDWRGELPKLAQLSSKITISRVFIHVQVFPSQFSLLPSDFQFGVALNPEDTIDDNWETIKTTPAVQIMTIQPGRQGTPFMPQLVNKVDELREAGYEGTITLDGGINESTLKMILSHKYWSDSVCPGSYFHEDTGKKLHKLQELVSAYQQSSEPKINSTNS